MMIRCLISLLCIIHVTSCVRLKEFPIVGNFEGVKTALERNSTVSVFIIHGVGGYSEGDPDQLIATMASKLHLRRAGPKCIREIIDDSDECLKSYGNLVRYDYTSCHNDNVRIYVLDWTNTTLGEKIRLQQMDASGTKARVGFINKIKETLVDQDLPDAVLYLSNYQQEIEYPVIQSIRWIEEDNQNRQNENIVIGFSLGGIIVINALDAMQQSEEHRLIAERYQDQISAVFILSNGYPLYELTEAKPNIAHQFQDAQLCSEEVPTSFTPYNLCWDWRKSPLGRFVFSKRASMPDFQIVAINDPNDIIGFPANNYPVPAGYGCLNAFLNENVRIAKTAIFGFVNPFTVHTGYGSNKKVLNMMIFGSP